MTTMATIDRMIHHSVLLDLTGLESYGAKAVATKKSGTAKEAVPA